jgi:hypothetical protein
MDDGIEDFEEECANYLRNGFGEFKNKTQSARRKFEKNAVKYMRIDCLNWLYGWHRFQNTEQALFENILIAAINDQNCVPLLDWWRSKEPDVGVWVSPLIWHAAKKYSACKSWFSSETSLPELLLHNIWYCPAAFFERKTWHMWELENDCKLDAALFGVAVNSHKKWYIKRLAATNPQFLREQFMADNGKMLRTAAKKKTIARILPGIGFSRSDYASLGIPWPKVLAN